MERAGSGAVAAVGAGITHIGRFEANGASGRRGSSSEQDQQNKAGRTCTICQKILSRPSHLNRHMRSVHGAEKRHQCSVCGARFVNGSNARRHAAHFHGDAASRVLPSRDNVRTTAEPRSQRPVFQNSIAFGNAYSTQRSEQLMKHVLEARASTMNKNSDYNWLTHTDDHRRHKTTDKSCPVGNEFSPDTLPDPSLDAAAPREKVVENNLLQGERREPSISHHCDNRVRQQADLTTCLGSTRMISHKRRGSTERAASCLKRPKTSPHLRVVTGPEVRSSASVHERRSKGRDRSPTFRHSPCTCDDRQEHSCKARHCMKRAQVRHTPPREQCMDKSRRCNAQNDYGETARYDRVILEYDGKCRRHRRCSRANRRGELTAKESDSGSEDSFEHTDWAHINHCRHCNHGRRNSHARHRSHHSDPKYASSFMHGNNKLGSLKKCAGEKLSDNKVDRSTSGARPVHPLWKRREQEKGAHTQGDLKRTHLSTGDYTDEGSGSSGRNCAKCKKMVKRESSNNMNGEGKSLSEDDRNLPDKIVSDDDEAKTQRHTSNWKTRGNDSFVKKAKALPTLLHLLLQETPTGSEVEELPRQAHCQGKRTWSTTAASETEAQGLLSVSRDRRNLESQNPCIWMGSLRECNEGSRTDKSCHRTKVQDNQTVNSSACVEYARDTKCQTSWAKHRRASYRYSTLASTGWCGGQCECNTSSVNRIVSEFEGTGELSDETGHTEGNGPCPNETHPQLSCRLRLAKRSHHKTHAASHQREVPCSNVHKVCNETGRFKVSETFSPSGSSHTSADGSVSSYDRNVYNLSNLVHLDAAAHGQISESPGGSGGVFETTRRRTSYETRSLSDSLLSSPRNSRRTRIGFGEWETPASSPSISLLDLSQGTAPQRVAAPDSEEVSCRQGGLRSATHSCDTCPSESDVNFSETLLSDEETALPTANTGGRVGCGEDRERPPTPEFPLEKEWIALHQAAAYCDEILAKWARQESRHTGAAAYDS